MSETLAVLLAKHARGEITRENLLRALRTTDLAQSQRWIGETKTESAAGRIGPELANAILSALTNANDRTLIAAEPTLAQAQQTLLRPSSSAPGDENDATEVKRMASMREHEHDATVASAASEPTVASRAPVDVTERKSADATERKSDVTERKVAAENDATRRQVRADSPATLRPPSDATVRMQPPQTAARTLHTPEGDSSGGFPPTLNAGDRTQIIAERLVKSLDEVDGEHHGPVQVGATIKHRFVLENLIGKGGMGLVFSALDRRKEEARDPYPRVALKVLNADFQAHPQSLIALQREARKAQSLAHPNVVTVFDFDRDGDAVYMTMELLKGRALEALVKEARGKGIAPSVALPIIRGIAEGLAYAHRKGIVHSDLKPGNVFLLDDGTPKILDFGIARAVPNAASPDEIPDVFDAGMLGAYTEAYATDEMVKGVDPHPADDMYSLGIIAYELLTGFHPYQRHSAPKARSLGAKPPPLKGLKMREARALERCLSFDRRQRPQSAGEFLKLFRGVTALQKALLAATVVLTVAAGYLSYENYREAGPSVPFSQLPPQVQEHFAKEMKEGDEAWKFVEREGNAYQILDAIDHYADAYTDHPRNREATKALKKAGDAFLEKADAGQRREAARHLQQLSDFYRRYPPVLEAAE